MDAGHAQCPAEELDVREAVNRFIRKRRRAKACMASDQLSVRPEHRKIIGLALVEQQCAHLAGRQAQDRAAGAGAHIRGNGIGIVEQGAVKGLASEVIGDGKRDGGAQCPHHHQRQHHMTGQPGSQ